MKYFFFFSVVVLFTACHFFNQKDAEKEGLSAENLEIDLSIAGSFSTQEVLYLDSALVDAFLEKHPKFNAVEKEVRSFYKNKKFALAWFDSEGLTEQAEHLYNRISNLQTEGLPDSALYLGELIKSMEACYGDACNAELDVFLTAQYFVYSKRISEGLPENSSQSQEWFIPRSTFSFATMIDSLLHDPLPDFLNFQPPYYQYALLKKQLTLYNKILNQEKENPFLPIQGRFEPGDSSEVIPEIKRKLLLLGDLEVNDTSIYFDQAFEKAVKSFQKRHGLLEDGIIGKSFVDQFNISIDDRIKQLIVNMERCRWFPKTPEGEFILVNIPEYKLHAFNGDSLYWSMKVIVGKELRKTVVFNNAISYVVFSPYWNVPPGIFKDEIWPKMQKDSNYLAKHKMEVIDWHGKYPRIREVPSPKNPLGKVKFLFPNKYSIYLHDSPSRSLFEKDMRSFSHGCIRVAEAEKLTRFLLKEQPEWTDSLIWEAMNANKERYVKLKKTMPVYIAYFTAWVDEKGLLNFRKDVYDRDKALEKMIFQK